MFERCKYANECDAQCSGAIENSETCDSFQLHQSLEQAVNQYNQVVAQNKDLQTECNVYRKTLENIQEFTELIYEQIPEDRVLRQILLKINEVLNG